MPIPKKVAEISLTCRVVAVSEAGNLTAANIVVVTDEFVINGVEQALAGLNAGMVTAINTAVENLHNNVKGIS